MIKSHYGNFWIQPKNHVMENHTMENHVIQGITVPWIFLMVRSYVSLTSINFLNVGGVFLNEILLSYLEAGSGVVKFYKIEFWVEVTFFILLLRASKHSQLLLFSKNGI